MSVSKWGLEGNTATFINPTDAHKEVLGRGNLVKERVKPIKEARRSSKSSWLSEDIDFNPEIMRFLASD